MMARLRDLASDADHPRGRRRRAAREAAHDAADDAGDSALDSTGDAALDPEVERLLGLDLVRHVDRRQVYPEGCWTSTFGAVARPAPKVEVQQPSGFVAPIDVPNEIKPEEALDLGVEGGVAGRSRGRSPGRSHRRRRGRPAERRAAAALAGRPDRRPDRAAALIRIVQPVFPDLAVQSRISALVILEAEVDVRGYVKNVKVLRGHPLFDESAMQAVKQWRYQPLLLNGEPTGFILTVTVNFNLRSSS